MKDVNRARWGFRLYYFLLVAAGILFFAYLLGDFPSGRWRDIFLFICLIIIADSVQISLPRGGASIYASSPIDLAGIVLFGRVIPGVRTLISIPAGLARMPFPRFFLATLAMGPAIEVPCDDT